MGKRFLNNKRLSIFSAILFLLIICSTSLFAAPITTTQDIEETVNADDEEKNTKSSFTNGQKFSDFMSAYFKPFVSNTNLFFTTGIFYTYIDEPISISPINYSLGIGYSFHILPFLLFQPHLTGIGQYSEWNNADNYAYPTEVENRTGYTLTAILDLPLILTVGTKKNTLGFGLGAAVFARYTLLANAVPAESLNLDGTTAEDDINAINSWSWKNLQWLYPEVMISYNHLMPNGWRLGLESRFYIPLASITSGKGMSGTVIKIGIRLVLPEPTTSVTLDTKN